MAKVSLTFKDKGSRLIELDSGIDADGEGVSAAVAMGAAVRVLFDSGVLTEVAVLVMDTLEEGGSAVDVIREKYGVAHEADT